MSLCIIVPCYNEGNRLPLARYKVFLNQDKSTHLLFVNDGSKDNTQGVLNDLSAEFQNQVSVLALEHNQGKAGAVRAGMQLSKQKNKYQHLAFLDADLSTSLEECVELGQRLNGETKFVFGSRILKTDNQIERKWYRFLIGRVIATVISKMLGISVYDTQCGCKIIDQKLIPTAFDAPFSSRWLFDVEIFFRLINSLGKKEMVKQVQEVPLDQWIDTEDSRVKFSYIFQLWLDLAIIYRRYKQ